MGRHQENGSTIFSTSWHYTSHGGGIQMELHTVGRFFLEDGPLLAINGVYKPLNGLINVVAGVILSL